MMIQLKAYGLGFLLMLTPISSPASVLSELAKNLLPGEFVELPISGSVSTCDAMVQPLPTLTPTLLRVLDHDHEHDHNYTDVWTPYAPGRLDYYGNILEFSDEALWYPAGREIYILGTRRPYARWDQGFVKYSEEHNTWTILELPPFGVGAHGYDNAAIDVSRGHYYWSRIGQSRLVWRMDLSTGVWQQLDNAPINSGQFSALEFFPELDRMVFFDGLVDKLRPRETRYALYNPEIESWESPVTLSDAPFGGISHFSEYNQDRGVMFFGGGFNYSAGGEIPDPTPEVDELRRFYMLDSNKVVTRLADPPTFLGQTGAGPIQTIDPNTGNLVVFQGKPNDRECSQTNEKLPIWEFNLDTNTWGQTGEQRLSSLYCAMDSVAVPLYEHGVIFIASVRRDNDCRVHLYRHSPGVPTVPSILTHPDDVTVVEGEEAAFNVVAAGSGPLVYQWSRTDSNGTIEIADTDSSRVTVTGVSASDSGSTYYVKVSNSLGSDISMSAELTVLSDTTAPTLLSTAASSTRVDIRFSEAVSSASAETISNYQLSLGITVTNASLSDDGRTISLTLSELTPDTNYTVSVSSVQDLAQTPNTIAAQSSINFTYRSVDNFEDGSADGWTPLTESRWEVVLDEGNYVYWLNTTAFSQGLERQLGEYSLLSGAYGDFTFTARARLGDDVDSNALADYAVVFGFQNANNYYFAMFNNQQSATQLFKVIDGNRTALPKEASSDWLTDNLYHRIVISRSGSEIKVYF
ncbi:MAG: Ig-like domain-containing protein, partial [Gammaproteobacteria bacterium]|nr:Ig-like domain-containing protein [Gammaproteobacteria bacterium]